VALKDPIDDLFDLRLTGFWNFLAHAWGLRDILLEESLVYYLSGL